MLSAIVVTVSSPAGSGTEAYIVTHTPDCDPDAIGRDLCSSWEDDVSTASYEIVDLEHLVSIQYGGQAVLTTG
jgi:hypothetical protein